MSHKTQEEIVEDLLRPLSPEEMEREILRLEGITFDVPQEPPAEGYLVFPYNPIWNPKPGPLFKAR